MMTGEQKLFDDAYERTLGTLTRRSESERFSLESVKQELSYLQIYEGQDWGGRGILKHSEIAAQILAYQVFIKRYDEQ